MRTRLKLPIKLFFMSIRALETSFPNFSIEKMKNNLKRYLVLAGIFTVGLSHTLFAQSIYKVTDSKNNNMKLSGTSTGHDWVMKAHIFTGEAHFDFKGEKDNDHTS